MKRFVFIVVFILTLVSLNLYAQLDTNAPWPMFMQNLKHTGGLNLESENRSWDAYQFYKDICTSYSS